jgi:Zn-dependent protease/CBS domain-containing protein
MRQTLRLGRIAGIAVGAHWSVLVIMVLLVEGLAVVVLPGAAPGQPWPVYWSAAIAGAVLFLLSLLAHELAHALVARRFGIRVERITLWLLGGVAEFADEAPTARADLLVAGVGPLTSIAAGLGFGAAAAVATALHAPAAVTGVFAWLGLINVLLAVFNLLPGAPLDGGRVLRAILWRWHGDRNRAAMSAARAGHGLGVVLVLLGIAELLITGNFGGLWLALLGWFLVTASNVEASAARYHVLLGRIPVRAAMHANPVCGHPEQSIDDFVSTVAVHSGHRAFPLRDADGHPAGVVRLADLSRVPPAARMEVPLSRVALPPDMVPVVEADQPLADVAAAIARDRLALVVDNGQLVGVVSTDDVTHASEIATLYHPRPEPS